MNVHAQITAKFQLTCETNSRNTEDDNCVFVILFFNSSHHNWLQDIKEDVNLNVVRTEYRQGYQKLYRRIISKNKCEIE